MSLNKSATRLSLLAGTSLLAALASAAAILSPATALAQATCVASTAVTGNGGNAVTIAGGTNDPGIACSYTGTVATVTTAGAITLSTTAPGGGIDLTATGANAINWNSVAGAINASAQTNGPVIEALSEAGAINITTGEMNRVNSSNTITDGIRAASSGGGAVTVNARSSIDIASSTGGDAGIEATSAGGNGAVTVSTGIAAGATTASSVSGRLRGIYAQASGTGALTLNIGSSIRGSAVGIEAVSGTGLLAVNLAGGPTTGFNDSGRIAAEASGGATGVGLLLRPGGNAVVNLGVSSNLTGTWGLDAVVLAGTTTTVNLFDYAGNTSATNDGRLTRAKVSGAGTFIINNDGEMRGAVDFTGLSNGATVNILANGAWFTLDGAVQFSGANDLLSIAGADNDGVGGVLFTGFFANFTAVQTTRTLDFGAGDDTIDNDGFLVVNPEPSNSCFHDAEPGSSCDLRTTGFAGEVRLTGLETFNNAGSILLGSWDDSQADSTLSGLYSDDVARTDLWYDDVLSMPGTTFVGEGGEVRFDVDIMRQQADCTTRNAAGDLGAADCLMLQGGATEGVTNVTIVETFPGDRGGANLDGIVLVDVAGGTSAQGHFVVGPNSANYRNVFGGVLDKGAFFFPIIYNEATQQHLLFGLPSDNALQQLLVAQAGHSLWRLSTGTWLDRQADLRGDIDDGVGGGVWMRVAGENAERDVLQPIGAAGQVFEWDNSHTAKSYAVMGGFDVLSGSGGDSAYVVGMMAGYVHSDLEYEQSLNQQRFNGASLGGYASLVSGGFFVDAAINAHRLTVREDIPTLNLYPVGTLVSTRAVSLGGQVEAGWRFPVMEGAFVEPLAGLSYVRTKYDDMVFVPDDATRTASFLVFDDPASLRAGVGARLGLDQDYGGFRAQYSALGRVWNEFEDEVAVSLLSAGPEMGVTDDISGQFTELGLGASLYSAGGAVSGFVNLGGRFGDDYQAQTGSVGVRVNW